MSNKNENQGTILRVKAIPKSSCNAIVGWENGELRIRLRAIPERGKANKELIAFLAKSFNLSKSSFELVSGETSCHKKLWISKINLRDLVSMIEDLITENRSLK